MTFCTGFCFENGRTLVIDINGNRQDFCEEIRVTHVFIDFHTGSQSVEITITQRDGQKISCVQPRAVIADDPIPPLTNCGLSVPKFKEVSVTVTEILLDTEKSAPRSYVHRTLGFCTIGGEQVFLAHSPIGCSDSRATSEFHIPTKTRPTGSLESWRALMMREVVGHRNLELALALSVTAPVVHLLRETKALSLIPIWALIGQSSTGKTTALKMMASVWGSPEESSGMITDLNATQNAFFAQLGNICGLPALIDETSSVPEWDFTKVLYNLPKGRDKLRCASDGSVRPSIHYSGAIILTGESTLFDQTNGNQGLNARLVEFTLPWTDDAAHAHRLEYGVRRNHGTAVYPLIQYLLTHKSMLHKAHNYLYESLKKEKSLCSGVEDRLLQAYATVCLSGYIIRASLKLPFDVQAIRSLLLDLHANNKRIQDDPALIFDKVKAQILDHYSHFPTDANSLRAPKIWGEHDSRNFIDIFWIAAPIFEQFLKNAGTTDLLATKKVFAERGWLTRSPDRHYTVRRKLGGVSTLCYRLNVDIHTYGPLTPKGIPSPIRKDSQIPFLLSEEDDA